MVGESPFLSPSSHFAQDEAGTSHVTTGRWRATSPSRWRYGFGMNANPPGSDPVYKRLYAFPEMVADLLRSLFPDDAFGADC